MSDKKRHWTEKVFWVIALFLSIVASSYFIYLTYRKYLDSPVIVSFSGKFMNIWEIPFPAVTICPSVLSRSEKLKGGNDSDLSYATTIAYASWKREDMDSNTLFAETTLDVKFCFSFNMMNFNNLLNSGV